MRIIYITLLLIVSYLTTANCQELPFQSIENTEKEYSSGTLVARMVEGLGFRYYWATEGLKKDDMELQPSPEARNLRETLNHLLNLSEFMLSALEQKPVMRSDASGLPFDSLRENTLLNFEKTVRILNGSGDDSFEKYTIKFANGGQLPFWNVINGPIADAIYHTGQVVMMRRMSGNPIDPRVNVLMGKGPY